VQIIDIRADDERLFSLQKLPHVTKYVSDQNQLSDFLQALWEQIEERVVASSNRNQPSDLPAIFLVIDNADFLYQRLESDYECKDLMDKIVLQGRNKNFYIAITGAPTNFPQYNTKDWFAEIQSMESGFLFSSLDSGDLSFMQIPTSESSTIHNKKSLSQGEGYFVRRRKFSKLKTAVVHSFE
jgi:S-DNA-T family DNA segregation ATPase FtsK/SpoIIIE